MKKRSSSQSAWALLASSVAEARVESHRIRHMVNRGQKVVDASVAKDHLYEVAGDLIVGVPERLTKLENLLDRTSYALSIMGEEFFRGRLSLSDKEMVDTAVKFSQTPFPSSRRVANRFLERKASLESVRQKIENCRQKGKITQPIYEDMLFNIKNLSDRYASILYDKYTFSSQKFFTGTNEINTKVPHPTQPPPKTIKGKKPNFNFMGSITLGYHCQYRRDLRDITLQEIQASLLMWNQTMVRGYYDNNLGRRYNNRYESDNANYYRLVSNIRGKGTIPYHDKRNDRTIVLGVSPVGTMRRFDLFVVTAHPGSPVGGYRSRLAYRQPVSQLPGATVFVNDTSKKNLTPNTSKGIGDNADSREKSGPQTTENKQQALPIRNDHSEKRDQKPPVSQTDGKGTSRPQFNTPPDSENAEGDRPIHKEKVRTRSMPGDQYGTPYKDDGYSLTRRTMKSAVSNLADRYLQAK